jgi:gliding motility-associated lipoprotein GldD
MNKILICCLICCFLVSCKETFTPKPRGYYRIELPEKQYRIYSEQCPFTFDFPVYGNVTTDNGGEPCWLNVEFPAYNGTIHLSYKKINKNLSAYIEDSRTFAYKHAVKADAINEKLIRDNNKNVYGIIYDIKGNVASSLQFFVTDSNTHFLRGALYFNTTPNKDSLAPVISFFQQDVYRLIESLTWK